jgi:hypothetical protein
MRPSGPGRSEQRLAALNPGGQEPAGNSDLKAHDPTDTGIMLTEIPERVKCAGGVLITIDEYTETIDWFIEHWGPDRQLVIPNRPG